MKTSEKNKYTSYWIDESLPYDDLDAVKNLLKEDVSFKTEKKEKFNKKEKEVASKYNEKITANELKLLREQLEVDLNKKDKIQSMKKEFEGKAMSEKYVANDLAREMSVEKNQAYSKMLEQHSSTLSAKHKDNGKHYNDVNTFDTMKEIIRSQQNEYNIGLIQKRKRDPQMEKDFNMYLELIGDSLFDEIFELLEKNASKIEDSIEQKRYIRAMLSGFFEQEVFENLLENEKWAELGAAMSRGLQRPFFDDIRNRFGTILDKEEANIITSVLIIDGKLEEAKTFIPHAVRDLSIYKSTIESVVNSKNLDALRFVCENFENIHFNSDELLSKVTHMKTEAITMLIDEFGFSLSAQNKLKNNLAINMIVDGELERFAWLNKNYGAQINYNHDNIFTSINKTSNPEDVYSIMLDNPHLKQSHIAKIGDFIFNYYNLNKLSQTNIFEKFFHHNAFDEQVYCLGQGYFIYGLLSNIGLATKTTHMNNARDLVRVLQTYLDTYDSDIVPDAVEYHIVGSAVHVAKVGNCQEANDACVAVMRRFGQYINRPNPSGLLPIQQTEKGSPLERLLLNNGAIHPEPEPTFWSNVVGVLKGKKGKIAVDTMNSDFNNNQNNSQTSPKSSISTIRTKMRNDFRAMQTDLADVLCDGAIKMKCENMFLKAEKVSMVMEKNNLVSFTDELHFLSENFSNYLKKSLNAYINLVRTSTALENQEDAFNKSEKAKKMCMEHVVLLTEQLDLMTSNIATGLNDSAMSQLKVSGRFLEERFNQTLVEDKSIDPIVGEASESSEAESVQIRKRNKP